MPSVSRRVFMAGAMAAASGLPSSRAFAQTSDVASHAISIIDASVDTSAFVGQLERAGVQVVVRYLSRGCQIGRKNSLARKRIAFNPPLSEADACGNNIFQPTNAKIVPEYELLLEKFALVSNYQYENDNPAKFAYGLPESHDLVEQAVRLGTPRNLAGATVEAQQDAQAALLQSKRIGQPDTAPIYFGVDFDMRAGGNVADLNGNNQVPANLALDGCVQYFEVLKRILGDRLGVYGNGYINRILRQEGKVQFSWISESRSFEETPKILREGFMKNGKKEEWHLFQHLIDATWTDPSAPENARVLELDGNVHNPAYDYFGAWRNGRLWQPELQRSLAILQNRKVAKRNAPVFDTTGAARKCVVPAGSTKPLLVGYHRSVQVHGDVIHDGGKAWLHVDVNDDGIPDGYCFADDFVGGIKQMPDCDLSALREMPQECHAG